jgi:hypothetical protein
MCLGARRSSFSGREVIMHNPHARRRIFSFLRFITLAPRRRFLRLHPLAGPRHPATQLPAQKVDQVSGTDQNASAPSLRTFSYDHQVSQRFACPTRAPADRACPSTLASMAMPGLALTSPIRPSVFTCRHKLYTQCEIGGVIKTLDRDSRAREDLSHAVTSSEVQPAVQG